MISWKGATLQLMISWKGATLLLMIPWKGATLQLMISWKGATLLLRVPEGKKIATDGTSMRSMEMAVFAQFICF